MTPLRSLKRAYIRLTEGVAKIVGAKKFEGRHGCRRAVKLNSEKKKSAAQQNAPTDT